MLVELAVGDAYGAGFEYVDRQTVARDNDIMHYVKHPRHRVIVGHYTDDTQMSIAIAEAIVEDLPWTPAVLAEKFVAVFKRDPREGYSARFHELLRRVNSGAELLGTIEPSSEKSGAAMRAASIGVVPTLEELIERATIQAPITHDTPSGTNAAVAAALMAHYLLYRLGPRRELGAFLGAHVPGEWAQPWQGTVKSKGWMSVRAAVTALTACDSMRELLRMCVAFSGDVDTIAAIALAAGACARRSRRICLRRSSGSSKTAPMGARTSRT